MELPPQLNFTWCRGFAESTFLYFTIYHGIVIAFYEVGEQVVAVIFLAYLYRYHHFLFQVAGPLPAMLCLMLYDFHTVDIFYARRV